MLPDGDGPFEHHSMRDLANLLPENALVVVNDTRVIPARLLGQKAETGGKVEIFLVRRLRMDILDGRPIEVWQALGKSSKPLRFPSQVLIGTLVIHLLGRTDDGLLEVGLWVPEGTIAEALRAHGHVPLPPYIKRDDEAADVERYQTVFARADGAVAAPTAGLHISRALLGRLAVRGCEVTSITLHVGLGTFQPVTVDDLDQHPMHSEVFEISNTAAKAITAARARGAPVVAIGTTVVRALESAADPEREGFVLPTTGETRLLIQPGYRFRVVDMLLTNFHLPRSTLLAMVCAFGGTERVLSAYDFAVKSDYRFFSYGDAMLLKRQVGRA